MKDRQPIPRWVLSVPASVLAVALASCGSAKPPDLLRLGPSTVLTRCVADPHDLRASSGVPIDPANVAGAVRRVDNRVRGWVSRADRRSTGTIQVKSHNPYIGRLTVSSQDGGSQAQVTAHDGQVKVSVVDVVGGNVDPANVACFKGAVKEGKAHLFRTNLWQIATHNK